MAGNITSLYGEFISVSNNKRILKIG